MSQAEERARNEQAPDPAVDPEVARSYRSYALVGFTVVLIVLCAYLVLPYLPALSWGVALAVIAWPLQKWIARRVPQSGLSAGLTTVAVIVLIVVPGLFVAYHIAREAESAAGQMRDGSGGASVRDRLDGTPVLGRAAAWFDRMGVDVDREVHRAVENNTRDISALTQGSLMAAVQFVVAMFIVYHLLRDRETVVKQARALLPMTAGEADRVLARAAGSVHANLHATLVTSVIDGLGGGFMFWLLGLPSPVTWGVVMFFLSFLPLLGTWLVWLPAAAFLAFTGQWPQALILLAWGVVFSIVVDNIIYVRIAGNHMRLHQVPALLAFLGGLSVFGASGMILGPGIWAVTVAVLDVWHNRATGATAAVEAPNQPANDRPAPNAVLRGGAVPAG